MLPLSTLLTVDLKSPYYNEKSKAGMFYAESWALVHYLMSGNQGKRQSQFIQFINGLNSDIPLEENFRQSFQADYKTIENELRTYVSRFLFPVWNITFTKQLDFAKEMTDVPIAEAEVQYYLGDLLLRSNRLEEAEARLQKSLELDGHLAMSQISLGILRLRQKKLLEAKKLMQDAITSAPRNPLGHFYYAYVLSQDEQYEEAIKSYKQAIFLKPDEARMYADLGFTYLKLARDGGASEAFKQALRLDARNPYLYRNLTYAYLRLARGELAAKYAIPYLKIRGWRDEHAPYVALAAHFGYRQAHTNNEADKILDEVSARGNTSTWPYPVVRYLRRAITAEELLALATDNDQLTEAHAYIGLDLSLNGNRDIALVHLRWVKENGNKNFVEYALALAELHRIEK